MGDSTSKPSRKSVLSRGTSLTMKNQIKRDVLHGIRAVAMSAALGSILGAATFVTAESVLTAVTFTEHGALIDLTAEG